ncbi:hypothetical protein GWK47_002544 [Chionoecetes opilio]|uniref:Uncharacterized protein n=1 Tax=Chionoecetes opilio TaxID=41210 RepID=A0A8J4XPS6_CHIOP|nr:hypothetical protein GWK47_002544 [Chionoecetes opilio]
MSSRPPRRGQRPFHGLPQSKKDLGAHPFKTPGSLPGCREHNDHQTGPKTPFSRPGGENRDTRGDKASTTPKKAPHSPILEYHAPTTQKGAPGAFGMAGYYRRFFPTSRPLPSLPPGH